jgi:hypothetical protein
MNGGVNIITKSIKATRGSLLKVGSGSETTARGLVQYGGKLRGHGFYRVFGQYSIESSLFLPSGQRGGDAWYMPHGGFRSDWDLTGKDSLTLQGGFLSRRSEPTRTSLYPGRSKLDSMAQTSRPAPGECPTATVRTRELPSRLGCIPRQFRIEELEEGASRRRAAGMDARIP